MKGVSITGLILGGLAPIIMVLPMFGGFVAGEDYWIAGWAFFFFTIPLGIILAIAGTVLAIIAGSLALRRGFTPKSVPITGIALAGAGLLLIPAGLAFAISGGSGIEFLVPLLGVACNLTGIIMCSVSGLRVPQRYTRAYR